MTNRFDIQLGMLLSHRQKPGEWFYVTEQLTSPWLWMLLGMGNVEFKIPQETIWVWYRPAWIALGVEYVHPVYGRPVTEKFDFAHPGKVRVVVKNTNYVGGDKWFIDSLKGSLEYPSWQSAGRPQLR